MAAQLRREHRNLIEEHNIHFDGPVSDGRWPLAHSETFKNIQTLGRTGFKEYRESVYIESKDKPWREQTKRRAERIAALAKRCREGRKNEAGWRMTLEPEILARFTIEVACPICRARLWRSELEVTHRSLDQFSKPLEERQKNRTPCTCRPGRRGSDQTEQGINMLFDDRAEEAIIHEPALQSLMRTKEVPDRVYGLRMTTRLQRLFNTEDKRQGAGGQMIRDSIKSSPFRPGGHPLVFPFLALEAKSEKSRNGFSDIETQTAFTIHSLLTLQEQLRIAAGEDSQWESGPLVWFLANKGEQWRVAAAYIDHRSGVQHHRIVDLWDGRVDSNDGALQLLLIVDYIFDWARDEYRAAIICELQSLAASNTASLARDSDIFSLQRHTISWIGQIHLTSDDEEDNPEEQEMLSIANAQDSLRIFDSSHGVLRDARYIRSRFMALHITEDNLSFLLNSMNTPEEALELARNILRCLKDSWRVSPESLDFIEKLWTSEDRDNKDRESWGAPNTEFHVTVTLSAYLSLDWEQTRELCCLAVSKGAVKELLRHANLETTQPWLPSDNPWIAINGFIASFTEYLSMGVKQNLLAAISRASVSTKLFTDLTNPMTNTGQAIGLFPDSHTVARELVCSIYNLHKIGRNEPSTSILRVSSRLGLQEQPVDGSLRSIWPGQVTPAILSERAQNTIFVTSNSPSNGPQTSELCIFLVDVSQILDLMEKRTPIQPHTPCKFQTTRVGSTCGWDDGWNKTDKQMHDAKFLTTRTHFSPISSGTNFSQGIEFSNKRCKDLRFSRHDDR